jgi:hypothetical protein
LDIIDDITITGAEATTTIIDGGGIDRVFDVRSSATVDLSALTIRNGEPSGASGGGVRIGSGSNVTLSNVIISGSSSGSGGGIHNSGTLILTDADLSSNSTPGWWGGGLYNNAANATLQRVTISGNSAMDGGGIYNFGVGASLHSPT